MNALRRLLLNWLGVTGCYEAMRDAHAYALMAKRHAEQAVSAAQVCTDVKASLKYGNAPAVRRSIDSDLDDLEVRR